MSKKKKKSPFLSTLVITFWDINAKSSIFMGFIFKIFKSILTLRKQKEKANKETTRSTPTRLFGPGRVGSGREGPTPCQSYGSDLLLRRLGPTRQSESKSSFTLINKARQRLQVTNLPPESHELMSGNTQKKKKKIQ